MKIISDMIELHVFRSGKDGLEFLLLKRSDKDIYPGLWQMVSGHIEGKETAVETALRELKEETGLAPLHLWVVPNVNSLYSSDDDSISVIPVFAAQVKDDSKIIISNEHTEFIWTDAAEAKKILAWDGQRKSVDLIEEYFLKEIHILQFSEINLESLLKKI
jgi:dATP pyrophosphohydrolase